LSSHQGQNPCPSGKKMQHPLVPPWTLKPIVPHSVHSH
jgi:hypothetical protein